jgi:fumarylacetoacetase
MSSTSDLSSWIPVSANSDFSIDNIPFGICRIKGSAPRVCTIIGDTVIDLHALSQMGYFKGIELPASSTENKYLNSFIALGKETTRAVRDRIQQLFSTHDASFREAANHHAAVLHPLQSVEQLLPIQIANYTDFYSSMEHATNVGSMFRDPANALLPNWKHIPIGYHGRASSITVSGTPFHRPNGQTKPADASNPVFGPTKQLDFELEMGFVVGKATSLGQMVSTAQAEDYIFGMVLFNDWSARDIQAWEYVPLGPFLAKNFNSTMSAWVVTLEALEAYRTSSPKQDTEVLPYLKTDGNTTFDIELEVEIIPEGGSANRVCRSNFKYLYWSMAQQLAHHTVNGCNICVGDVYASGTISGSSPDTYGSMLELSWRGTKPLTLNDQSTRSFIADGDEVLIKGYCSKNGKRIGFGKARSKVLPAKKI